MAQKTNPKDLAWETSEGEHFVIHEERYNRMLSGLTDIVLGAAKIQAGENVLDVGCGAGALCFPAKGAAGDGRVHGVDISGVMLERARQSAAEQGLENITFQEGDAQTVALPADTFDVAMSRLGVMFFTDQRAAWANVLSAMRPGGRLSFVTWRNVAENENMMVPLTAALEHIPNPDFGDPEALSPFSLADPDVLRAAVEGAGWVDVGLEAVDDRAWWGSDAEDVAAFIRSTGRAQILTRNADPATVDRAFAAVCEALKPYETPDGVYLGGAVWLVTGRRPS